MPLETAIASLFIGLNLWVSTVVVGTNKLYCMQYSGVYCIAIPYVEKFWWGKILANRLVRRVNYCYVCRYNQSQKEVIGV